MLLKVCFALQGLLVAILYCFVNKEVGLMDLSAPSSRSRNLYLPSPGSAGSVRDAEKVEEVEAR